MSKPKGPHPVPETEDEDDSSPAARTAERLKADLAEMSALDFTPEKAERLSSQPLNALEKMVVASLVAYIAYSQSYGEETVQSLLAAQFGVATPEKLTAAQYNDVIRYLASLHLKTAVN